MFLVFCTCAPSEMNDTTYRNGKNNMDVDGGIFVAVPNVNV
jgi:hypothetical protein